MTRPTRPIAPSSALPEPAFEARVRVYYEDTDAGGIVYHANWLRYFERARTDWLRSLGAVHRELADKDGVLLVVRDLAIDYRQPARLDDELRTDVCLLEARRATLRLVQSAYPVQGGDYLVRAEMRVAAIDARSQRAAALPRWLHDRLQQPRLQSAVAPDPTSPLPAHAPRHQQP